MSFTTGEKNKNGLLQIDYQQIKSPDAYHQFADKVAALMDMTKNRTPLQSNPHTGNIIVPDELLAEQGSLLVNYILHPETRPKESVSEDFSIEQMLFDAAFKTCNSRGQIILAKAIRLGIKDKIKTLISQGRPEQLYKPDNEQWNALMRALNQMLPKEGRTPDNEEICRLLLEKAPEDELKNEKYVPYNHFRIFREELARREGIIDIEGALQEKPPETVNTQHLRKTS